MAPAVGIDLGTTYSAVAWMTPGGKPEVIADEAGEPLTPSVVSFAAGRPVVGPAAKEDQARGEQDVAAYFKSRMGDREFRRFLGGRDWTATGLSSLVLGHLKAQAEQALGQPVTRAVITVPEYFTHPQRTATMEAGRIAGLDVPRIISEPTAAALAYGLRPGASAGRFLVYDLGGGTFDVSLVALTADSLDVLAAAGDHELGGRDWDDRLALELHERFRAETGGDLLATDNGALLVAVEQLKRSLSARRSAEIRVGDGQRTSRYTVSRAELDAMTADLLERTALLTGQALADAGLAWADVDGVLPVGGSTRMPMVAAWVERMSGRPPLSGIHPDHAVALGAAVQAALLPQPGLPAAGSRPQGAPALPGSKRIRDVVAHSLGMIAESEDGQRYVNSILLRRNTAIPSQEVRPYQFDVPASDAELEVYLTQGETGSPAECSYLGRYQVTGFPAGTSGPDVIDVAYAYDENAVVGVEAVQRSTGARLRVVRDELPDDVPDRFLGPPARPRARGPVTVYLAFDLSGSMSGRPLLEAQRAAHAFVSQVDLTSTAVGLIAFSDSVLVELAASQSATAIGQAIDGLRIGRTGIGNAGHPFDHLLSMLDDRAGGRYGVVLADGVWSRQPHAVERAQHCHRQQIEIIAIGFGQADRKFLGQIASSTEQAFFTTVNDLATTFSTIARELTEGTPGTRRGVRSR
ncbi:MAG TPA: Hsp70 family protein [Trebonia sp.]|jgi:molecular chaperone DnaK (HSP70)|nr:Hsp70 family protein [Trebonia sp.]